MKNEKTFWDERGVNSYNYKGETFYTITAIPFYYKRRQLLLELMTKIFQNSDLRNICDFGCGDGWYLKYFTSKFLDKEWYGVDLSETMILLAKKNCPLSVKFDISPNGIPFDASFDLIYSIAVFAHVMDDQEVIKLFNNINNKLNINGRFIVFEQTAPERKQGDWWCRRTSSEYIQLALQAGFEIESRTLIRFTTHNFFERHLAPYIINFLYKGENSNEKRIKANGSLIYRILSSIMVALSPKTVRLDDGSYGNTLLVFRRIV